MTELTQASDTASRRSSLTPGESPSAFARSRTNSRTCERAEGCARKLRLIGNLVTTTPHVPSRSGERATRGPLREPLSPPGAMVIPMRLRCAQAVLGVSEPKQDQRVRDEV